MALCIQSLISFWISLSVISPFTIGVSELFKIDNCLPPLKTICALLIETPAIFSDEETALAILVDRSSIFVTFPNLKPFEIFWLLPITSYSWFCSFIFAIKQEIFDEPISITVIKLLNLFDLNKPIIIKCFFL